MKLNVRPNGFNSFSVEFYGSGLPPALLDSTFTGLWS